MAKWENAPIVHKADKAEKTDTPKWELAPIVKPLVSEGVDISEIQSQVQPDPLKEKSTIVPTWGMNPWASPQKAEREGFDIMRSLKDYGNIGSEFLKTRMSSKRWANKAAIVPLALTLSKIEGRPFKEAYKEILGEFNKAADRIKKFEVKPAETVGEKVADIAVGVSKFMTKLALLKKIAPNAPEAAIWEMENLSSGGIPGIGYATHGVFQAPGKIITGNGKVAKVGKISLEAGGLATLSAIESKIDTGEIDWKSVAISAGLPVALRTPSAIKKLIKARHPKVIKAVAKVHPELKVDPKASVTFETTNKAVEAQIVQAKIINATERKVAVKALRKQQSARYTAKRKELKVKGLSRKEAHKIAARARGGKAAVPEMTPLVLTPEQRAIYDARIDKAYPLGPKSLTNANAMDVLTKLENGQIPTNYEFGLLEPVIGKDTLTKVYKAIGKQKKLEWWDVPTLVRDVPKAIRFGFDPQAARGLSKITIRHPLIYLSTLGKNIRGIFSKKYSDRISTQIETSPAYKLGKEGYKTNYLSMKPWASVEAGTKLEQYGHISEIFLRSNNRIIKGVGKWLQASERGANLGMNSALNKLVVKGEKDLARYNKGRDLSKAAKDKWRIRRGHDINIFTKRITTRHPKGKAIQRAANWLVFSPAYTASGLVSGPQSFLKLATGKGFADKTYAMQIMLSRLAGLTAVSSVVGYAGYKYRIKNPTEEPLIDSSPNPVDPLFGKIRQGNEVYDLGFGDVADYRLMARIGLSAHMATKEALTGKQVTTTIGGKKIPTGGEALGRYLESKRTLYLSLAKQLLTGKDWLGKSVTLKDTVLDNLPFEFFQAFIEAGEADGLWADMADGLELDNAKKTLGNLAPSVAALGGVGTGSYPVHTSTTRAKFKDIIAKDNYGEVWDELTTNEQGILKREHRKQFDFFAEKIRKERATDPPFSGERMEKEEREAKQRVTKMLSVKNRKIIKDIKLNMGRRPKDFYLNDERYNRYQELVAEFMEEKMSNVDFSKMEDKRRVARVQVIVKAAKSKAFSTLRREIR